MKLTLEKPTYGGDCLAHLAHPSGKTGKTVFVPLTLPGEIVSAIPTEDKRTYAKAEVEKILLPSPNRVVPDCPYFGACGGCHYQHANYPSQLAMKQQILRETLQRARVAFPETIEVVSAEPWAYRNRIRVAMDRIGGQHDPKTQFGYRSRRSHNLVPINQCPIAAPLLVDLAQQTTAFLSKNPMPVSELEIFTNHDESQILLTIFCERAPDAEAWLTSLRNSLPSTVTSLRLQMSDGAPEPSVLAALGQPSLIYNAAGFNYQVDHGAFFQGNRRLLDQFVAVVTVGQAGGQAWDLYAGVGLFSRPLTQSFRQVFAVETAPASFTALQQNLSGTCGRAIGSTTYDFLRRNREQREPRPDLIVLDPPRAGLGQQVTQLLNAIHAPKMVYVSCDPTTLARDLRALTQERYRIDQITQVDMFPQTFHMETVARLSRI